jgi:hypothetical protein
MFKSSKDKLKNIQNKKLTTSNLFTNQKTYLEVFMTNIK